MNDDQKITYFGETNFRNRRNRFGIKKIDRRKHMYVIGKTGMGKTTLLENMAVQDIQSGEGIAFIDPHGDTAEKLLDFVPKERISDVIYFNPADTSFPIGLNVMESVDIDRRHLVADGLMGVFKKIWADVWSPRMEYILNNTILALLEYPNATMLGINQMLVNKDYRKKVVDNVTDPVIKAFWTQEFAKYTDRYAAEATPAIQNKVGQFVSNPLIRNIIGQTKSAFDFRKAMDERKIIIVNLSKGRVGEDNSRLLGAMFVTKLYLAAMSRVDILESKRADFFLYVDEFQNFASQSFANILSEARKYRLSLILTHQYVAQMEEEVRDAVFGNVGTTATFRIGAEDAELLEKEFSPDFTVEDIVNLGFANIYLRLMIDGVASRPFSATTLPPIAKQEITSREEIIEASRKTYGTEKKEAELEINKWAEEVGAEIARKSERGERGFGGERGGGGFGERMERTETPRPQIPLFDAICAVCGKKTQVPFQPDPSRPVFCKEHIGMAGQYKTQLPPRPAPRPFLRPSYGELVRRETRRMEESPQPISLSELKRPQAGFGSAQEARPKKDDSLQALREALKKSLESKKEQNFSTEEKEKITHDSFNSQQEAGSRKQVANLNSGTLRPGDKLEL